MARRAKLTEEMVEQAIRLKADGLSNGDIICALGIHESTFYRWIGEPKNRLQRELSEGLKKEEAEFKHTLLTTIRAAALARNQYWTAAAWLLERKYPDEYGKADRRRDGDEGGGVPRIVLGVVAKPVQQAIDFSAGEGPSASDSSPAGSFPADPSASNFSACESSASSPSASKLSACEPSHAEDPASAGAWGEGGTA
jgi:transposase